MNFLSKWTIDIEDIPAYKDFNKPFFESVDKKLANLILNSNHPSINEVSRQEFQKLVNCVNNDKLMVKYSPRFDLGRRYPDCPVPVLPNGNPNPNYSKYYSALIAQQRIIKNTLFHFSNWVDLDQKKGHPTILLSVARKNNFELKSYEHYLADGNFDKIVSDFSEYYSADSKNPLDKSDIKMLFNMTIYGGGHKRWCENIINGEYKETDEGEILYTWPPKPMKNIDTPHKFYIDFHKDTQRIISTVYNSNPALINIVCKDLEDIEWKRKNRVMSYFCGILENEITYKAYKWLVDNHIIERYNVDWGLDGLTFPKPNVDASYDYIEAMNNFVRKKIGMPLVTFEIKKFNDDEILHELIEQRKQMPAEVREEVVKEEKEEESYDDVTEAKQVLSKYPHWKYCGGELYCFDSDTGLWMTDKIQQIKIIEKYTRGKYKKYMNYKNNVRSQIQTMCVDNDFITKNVDSSLGKLLFKNGYYDSATGVFHYEFNPNILFFARISHDFKRVSDAELQDVRKRFFYDPLSEVVGDYYLQILSRAIMGEKMKKIVFGIGKTDCGKSTITTVLKNSFEDYVGIFNANCLTKKDVSDIAQALRWTLLLRYKRIIFSNEMDDTKELNGAMLKSISGNDVMIAREHCKNETEFEPHFLPFCFANQMSEISPYDPAMDGRIDVFDYKKQFKREPDPNNPDELKMDVNLKAEINTEVFQQKITCLFITEFEKYKKKGIMSRPIECENAKEKWVTQASNIDNVKTFLEYYEITNNPNDKVFSKEIMDFVKELESKVNYRKFVVELKEYLQDNNFSNVMCKSVSISNVKGSGWTGIKIKPS